MTGGQGPGTPEAGRPPLVPAPDHCHQACVAWALAEADRLCAARGVRLTPLRRRVLALVWASHRPRGAYAILKDLGAGDRSPAPLTVYRALDFLVAHGLVHRIESLNAFVGCRRPDSAHNSQFLVCDTCGTAVEVADRTVAQAIETSAAELGFAVTQPTVEIHGVCRACRAASDRDPADADPIDRADDGAA